MKLFTLIIIAYSFLGLKTNSNQELSIDSKKSITENINLDENLIIELYSKTYRGSKTWYYKKNGRTYKICKDGDGIRVRLPNGNHHSYGTGWSLKDVKRAHGLSNISPYRSSTSASDCS